MTKRTTKSSIARRLFIIVFIVSMAISLLIASIATWLSYRTAMNNIETYIEHIEAVHLPVIRQNLWVMDKKAVEIGIEALLHVPLLTHVVIEQHGTVIMEAGNHENKQHILSREFPLFYSYKEKTISLGIMKIDIDTNELRMGIWQGIIKDLSYIIALVLMVTFLIYFLFQRLVTRHLLFIASHLQQIGRGSAKSKLLLEGREPLPKNPDEIDQIVSEINSMNVALTNTFDGLREEIETRKQVEEELRESENHLQLVFENAPVALFQEDFSEVKAQIELLRQEGVNDFQTYLESHPEIIEKCAAKVKMIDVNRAALNLHNANTAKDLLEDLHKTFTEDSYRVFCHELIALANGADSFRTEATVQTLDREKREVLLQLFIDPNRANWSCVYVSLTDITDRKKAEQERLDLETQLRQKYKMEAIGVMAGGIAHNFNNNLSIILGNVELSQLKGQDPAINELLNNAKIATLRSRDLVNQIMTYSRKSAHNQVPLQLPMIINETIQLLSSTLPSTVQLTQMMSSDSYQATINANSSQIQEVLLNLCNNAVHAMGEEGELNLTLDVVYLKSRDIADRDKHQPGHYTKLSIKDNGCGMSPETMEKIFDPFFTTKDVHKGTGMGLATVQGIVDQHGGLIKVKSILGEGTTFDLYFPVIEQPQAVKPIPINPVLPKGTEKILFVDDDQMLAELGGKVLTEMGYRVVVMTESSEALKLFTTNPDHFDLLITDQTMPGLTGKDLIQKLLKIRPDLPTILCTGYSSKVNEDEAKELGARAFCMKPLDLPELLQTIRRVLDEEK